MERGFKCSISDFGVHKIIGFSITNQTSQRTSSWCALRSTICAWTAGSHCQRKRKITPLPWLAQWILNSRCQWSTPPDAITRDHMYNIGLVFRQAQIWALWSDLRSVCIVLRRRQQHRQQRRQERWMFVCSCSSFVAQDLTRRSAHSTFPFNVIAVVGYVLRRAPSLSCSWSHNFRTTSLDNRKSSATSDPSTQKHICDSAVRFRSCVWQHETSGLCDVIRNTLRDVSPSGGW